MESRFFDTVIVGSGCAGLNCADVLLKAHRDVAIVTDGIKRGTSANASAGSQSYCFVDSQSDSYTADAARELVESGVPDGEIALSQAARSSYCFMKLAQLGVEFPRNEFGGFLGFPAENSEKLRVSCTGETTSRQMHSALLASVSRRRLNIIEKMHAVELIVSDGKAKGVICIDSQEKLTAFFCNNLVIATGGAANIYEKTAFPESQCGSIGMLYRAGVRMINLNCWTYELASLEYSRVMSGPYQFAIPAYISVSPDGSEREFLRSHLTDEEIFRYTFLKGIHRQVNLCDESETSVIDRLILREIEKGNRIYLDYTENPEGFSMSLICDEGRALYSELISEEMLPYERLEAIDPDALRLFRKDGLRLDGERVEISVCAVHMNGGAEVDMHGRTNISNLYVIGEAAGGFGADIVNGSFLNYTQTSSLAAAEHIINNCPQKGAFEIKIENSLVVSDFKYNNLAQKWRSYMAKYCSCVRIQKVLLGLYSELLEDIELLNNNAVCDSVYFTTKDILYAVKAVLISSICACRELGSQGSCLVRDITGSDIFKQSSKSLRLAGEKCSFFSAEPAELQNLSFYNASKEFKKQTGV